MIFKNVKAWALFIALIFISCNILYAETTITLIDKAGSIVDVFGYHSYQEFFNPDCSRMVTSMCNKVIVWDTQTSQPVLVFGGDADLIATTGVFSPNGELILIVSERRSPEATQIVATVHNAHTGKIVCLLKDFNATSNTFSPDSTKIMGIGANNNVAIWDAQTGSPLFTLDAKHVCAFSPNGKTIINAARSENDTKVFDAQTGKLIAVICNSMCYGFSQDGNRILVLQKTPHDETQPEFTIVSLESNLACIDDHIKYLKVSTDYSLIAGSSINPVKFAFRINQDQGYAILNNKKTGQEKILSLTPDSVPVPGKRAFHLCSIEA